MVDGHTSLYIDYACSSGMGQRGLPAFVVRVGDGSKSTVRASQHTAATFEFVYVLSKVGKAIHSLELNATLHQLLMMFGAQESISNAGLFFSTRMFYGTSTQPPHEGMFGVTMIPPLAG